MKTAVAYDLEPWRELVRLEYANLPAMRLTLVQAQRLWSLDAELCQEILDSLVETRDLAIADGRYCRADCVDGVGSLD